MEKKMDKEGIMELIDFLGNKRATYGMMVLLLPAIKIDNSEKFIKSLIFNKENDFEVVSYIMAVMLISGRDKLGKWMDIFRLPFLNKNFFYPQYVLGYILAIMSVTNWFLEKEELDKKDPLITRLNSVLLGIVPKLSLTDSLIFERMKYVFLFTGDNSRAPFEGHLTSVVKQYVRNNPEISLIFMEEYYKNMGKPTGTTTKLGDLIVEQMAYAEFNKLNAVQKAKAILKKRGIIE